MKKLLLSGLFVLLTVFALTSCSKVPAGNVGIKFYLLGGDKGVDFEPLSPGRYWIGINEELYLFPTQTQNYVWTSTEEKGSEGNEELTFQDKEGMILTADVGITYHIDESKVPNIFQKYKKGIDEITDLYLRNMVRDALVKRTSMYDADHIYGEGRSQLIDDVQADVITQVEPLGIVVEKIYWIGAIRLPAAIIDAINLKIKATQTAQQSENELRDTEAKAKKVEAEATGQANAITTLAKAQAEANRILSQSITPTLIEYEKVKKWNGQNSQVVGSTGGLMLNLK